MKTLKATSLSCVVEIIPGELEEVTLTVGDTFTVPKSLAAQGLSNRGPHEITGFAPASYANRVITDYGLFPVDMVAQSMQLEGMKTALGKTRDVRKAVAAVKALEKYKQGRKP
jgi:hypothetical protein